MLLHSVLFEERKKIKEITQQKNDIHSMFRIQVKPSGAVELIKSVSLCWNSSCTLTADSLIPFVLNYITTAIQEGKLTLKKWVVDTTFFSFFKGTTKRSWKSCSSTPQSVFRSGSGFNSHNTCVAAPRAAPLYLQLQCGMESAESMAVPWCSQLSAAPVSPLPSSTPQQSFLAAPGPLRGGQ